MKNSDFYKEKGIYENLRTSKDINDFTITKQLGKGSSGFVRNAIHNQTQKKVIIKYVVKSLILRGCWTYSNDNAYKKFPNEIAVLQNLYDKFNGDVPNNLTKLIAYWEDSIYYYLVFADTEDFNSDLFDYIDKTTDKMMSEKEAKIIFKNIVEAIQTLHHNHIVHRDIKDENVLINYQTKEIQLIDFGSSTFYKKDQKLSNFVGSFLFAAPEIVKGMTYEGPPQDIWSLGILLYTMIYKAIPFNDYYEIIRKKMTFPQSISNECKELIIWMTNRDSSKRPTIDQVLNHSWLN
ncbi:kinase-like protein [Piromyces finnis]|uniref:Kinase-like protein n=1 Tax=Piromyces finnis TaxID=1754191 RepID=A0A1Y1V5I2_9FUNG|nr:kinase-like protein [Piromyces finnis]|eukprot:ORX47811.1 kinase-like protein [Piromyces finnis]